jgi:hypothetical protein
MKGYKKNNKSRVGGREALNKDNYLTVIDEAEIIPQVELPQPDVITTAPSLNRGPVFRESESINQNINQPLSQEEINDIFGINGGKHKKRKYKTKKNKSRKHKTRKHKRR